MFLKYLVDKKHVTVEQLLEGVIQQMESMPALLRVILEEGNLSQDQAYQYLIEGLKSGKSFLEVVRAQGSVSDEELFAIFKKQNEASASLGDVFIKHGILERSQYDQILRDYTQDKSSFSSEDASVGKESTPPEGSKVELKEGPEEQTEKQNDAAPANSAPSMPAGISAAALESLKAVSGLDESAIAELEQQVTPQPPQESHEDSDGDNDSVHDLAVAPESDDSGGTPDSADDSPMRSEYLEVYDDMFQSNLYVVANRYRLKGKEKDLEELHTSFIKLLSLAKLNNFSFQVKLLEPYENIMGLILNGVTEAREDWQGAPAEALEILWEFRKVINEGMPEGKLLADSSWKDKYLLNLKGIMTYIKKSA